ncbi:MAG: formate dehydrogenase accessory sulfurtransferase FdhD [Acidobacteria bacterium]|nr:formate dehydrogenase accessory sulfurtransferase FdhD [Acidobacteriota bacterium]
MRTGPGTHEPLLVTMRTPGADEDLACGLLLTLGVLRTEDDLVALEPPPGAGDEHRNALVAVLGDAARRRLPEARHLAATAACGVCGARSREEVVRLVRSLPSHREDSGTQIDGRPFDGRPFDGGPFDGALLANLPERVGSAQAVFRETGGLHAAALFSPDGTLVFAREDIGRHNAVDKVIGTWWKAGRPPSPYLFVSGRAGFEIVQTAAMAGIEALVAVGAPSSLAVELAEETGLVLAAFARQGRLNVYAGADRVGLSGSP